MLVQNLDFSCFLVQHGSKQIYASSEPVQGQTSRLRLSGLKVSGLPAARAHQPCRETRVSPCWSEAVLKTPFWLILPESYHYTADFINIYICKKLSIVENSLVLKKWYTKNKQKECKKKILKHCPFFTSILFMAN